VVEDTAGPGNGAEHERPPSPEEVREYMQRMRSLPVEEVIAEVLFSLLNAAQIKLGRRDARLLIDVSTVAHEHARPYLSQKLTKQVDELLGQLRLSQVSAEGQPSRPDKPEENDLDRVPAAPSVAAAQSPPSPQPASKLWVPGR
jgi:hypothetical protein